MRIDCPFPRDENRLSVRLDIITPAIAFDYSEMLHFNRRPPVQENTTLLHIPGTLRREHTLTDTAELLLLLLLSRLCVYSSSQTSRRCIVAFERNSVSSHRVRFSECPTPDHLENTWNVSHPGLALPIATGTCGHVVEPCRVMEPPRPAPPRLIWGPTATPLGLENALRATSGNPRQSDRLREPRQDERTCNLSAYLSDWQPPARSVRHGWHLSNWFARFTTSGSTDPSIQILPPPPSRPPPSQIITIVGFLLLLMCVVFPYPGCSSPVFPTTTSLSSSALRKIV
ncbi:hypothetical protein EAG_09949 [Camponotus floridanus]|uniref:Uncharacterized protein n=1 Tax=Camponotus floridanus TaxID=104421 RepID=E2ADF8_CAMFO|nr:hypothetical protein EAG_09949 [Camponotus floridanus]